MVPAFIELVLGAESLLDLEIYFLYVRKICCFERLFTKRKMINSTLSILYCFFNIPRDGDSADQHE